MSDKEEESPKEEYRWYADRAKTGRASCKKCKQKIESGELRMAKSMPSPFGSGLMKSWHHIDCMFQVFSKQRATTAKIESVDDIGGWDKLLPADQEEILKRFPDPDSIRVSKKGNSIDQSEIASPVASTASQSNHKDHKDNSFREFRRLCADIANVPGYIDKTKIVKKFITDGTDGNGFKGDLLLTIKLLLPGVIKRVYNLQSKQIVKLFSRIFGADQDEMLTSLEQGDVAETIREFFDSSTKLKPAKKSSLTSQEVDAFLEHLSKLTREEDQINHFTTIATKCTSNDLKLIIRLIKHDLRINAGAKHILDAVHEDAYQAFQASRDLNSIINKVNQTEKAVGAKKTSKGLTADLEILVPVLPMLAQMCRSAEDALKSCPNGFYSEIKYDGERVQVHKKGNTFKYFSRSLKPVLPHKVKHLEEFIPKAFPHGKDLVLDSEILMIDNKTGIPLPFGSLGLHKKNEYKDANVCLFVFDCLYYNGESLLKRPLKDRKQILQDNMTEIKNRVVFSEMKKIDTKKGLNDMITSVMRQGLEGLVLKDILSPYEPGKRHWLKIKKDYLYGGALADTADLVVLGAFYGTGQKGGMMSVFLMGCYDEKRKKWVTVTKVHTGHDDKTLERLQTELKMVKISKNMSLVPSWLHCTKTMVPDFVAADPKDQPVWEITGAELTKNVVHTADGISVRFPRVTRIRDDKDWKTATTLKELHELYEKSKQTSDFSLDSVESEASTQSKTSPKKRKAEQSPSSSPVKKKKYDLQKPLPDIFVGMKISTPAFLDQEKKEILQRYFVAYGGELAENGEKPTHRIVQSNESVHDTSTVPISAIWKSIKKGKLAL